jgi:hypothetical protein
MKSKGMALRLGVSLHWSISSGFYFCFGPATAAAGRAEAKARGWMALRFSSCAFFCRRPNREKGLNS